MLVCDISSCACAFLLAENDESAFMLFFIQQLSRALTYTRQLDLQT